MAPSQLTEPIDRTLPAHRAVELAPCAGRLDLDDLPGRDLDADELRDLVATIAADPDRWAHLVGFDDDERVYASLHRDAHVDVWLLCWTPANDTGWHDHDLSSGAVAVTRGRLVEHNLAIGTAALRTEVPAGTSYSFGPDHIHRMTCLDPGSVSIHAYSPPLWRLGQYAVSATGVLRRTSVSYADELRPID